MSINTLTYNKSIFHFLSGMQGSVPNRMLLSCPFRDAFMVYCTQESCRMEESSCIWQLPAQSLILVRAGQTPAVAPAATKTLHFSSFLAEGKLPFCTDSEPAVFVPIPGSDLFDFCTELAAQPPSAETDWQLTALSERIQVETQALAAKGTLPPASIRTLKQILDTRYTEKLTLDSLSKELHWNKYKLDKDFKRYYGSSPFGYLLNVRVEEACTLLRSTSRSVLDIGFAVGIENTSYFIRLFKKRTGMSPLAFRTHFSKVPESRAKKDTEA